MFLRLYVKAVNWVASFKYRMRNQVDKDRTLISTVGILIYIVAGLLVSLLFLFGWLTLSLFTGIEAFVDDPKKYAGVMASFSVLLNVFTYGLIFYMPLMRKIIHENGGLGLKTSDLPDRMHVKTGATSSKKAWAKVACVGVLLGAATFGVSQLASMAILSLYGAGAARSNSTTETILSTVSAGLGGKNMLLGVLMLLASIIVAPVLEEMLFRGLYARSLVKSSIGVGQSLDDDGNPVDPSVRTSILRQVLVCIMAGVIFGVCHLDPNGAMVTNLTSVLTTSIIGALFTWVSQYKYDSIWPTMVAHVVYNAITMGVGLAFVM